MRTVLCLLFLIACLPGLSACGRGCSSGSETSVPEDLDRIYQTNLRDAKLYGRFMAVDTLVARVESGDYPRYRVLEVTRGQTPRGLQAEARVFEYSYPRGFTEQAGGGLYTSREHSVRAVPPSTLLRWVGAPATGLRLELRAAGEEFLAGPLAALRRERPGLAEYDSFSGPARWSDADGHHAPATLYHERFYIPGANTFDGPAAELWGARALLYLFFENRPDPALLIQWEENRTLRGLVRESRAHLTRAGRTFTAEVELERGGAGPAVRLDGRLLLKDQACALRLESVHAIVFYSIARAESTLAAVRGELRCPKTTYRLEGLGRWWP